MQYQFPPDVEKLVQEQMVAGNYRSEDELLRDALRALDEQRHDEQGHIVIEEELDVVEGVRRGLADMEAGRYRSLKEFDAEFRSRHNIRPDA